jgi:ABC-type uncharacterized transport system substrate-binding protein
MAHFRFETEVPGLRCVFDPDEVLEFRYTSPAPIVVHGNLSLGPQLAAELVALPVDVIVAEGVTANAVDATDRIPIVAPAMMDPVQRGWASSLSRPGGNITGFTLMHTELNAKRLELLRTAFPRITAVTALVNSSAPSHKLALEQTETAARLLGLGGVAIVEAESAAALQALRLAVFSGAGASLSRTECSTITDGISSGWSTRRAYPPSTPSANMPTTAG